MTSTSYSGYYSGQIGLYDNTSIPCVRTGTPDTSTWWKCCGCDREVNPDQHQNNCPDCGHTRCDSCKSTSPPLTPVKDYFGLDFEAPSKSHAHVEEAGTGYHEHAYHGYVNDSSSHHSYSHTSSVQSFPDSANNYGRPHSMDGWWTCCLCANQTNSAWYGNECTACNHDIVVVVPAVFEDDAASAIS